MLSTAVQQIAAIKQAQKCNHDFSRRRPIPDTTDTSLLDLLLASFFLLQRANGDCRCRCETAAATVNRCRNVDEVCERTRPENKMYKHQKFTQLTLI